MNSTALSILAAVLVVGLALLFIVTNSRRDRKLAHSFASTATVSGPSQAAKEVEEEAREAQLAERKSDEVVEWVPPTEEAIGVSRRQFFNRGILAMFAVGLGGFGAACLAFLWPNKVVGFGGKVNAGAVSDIMAQIKATKAPLYVPQGRFYLQPYPQSAVPKAELVNSYKAILPGMEQGLVALYQKCVHLGCKVPWCQSSQWFECPCHGSRYNRVGEKKGGPAPRGLDRFVLSASGGNVIVDTGHVILGPPVGTNTTGQEAEGPHC
jgi:cytochrome b6-f complex iron-sulfur subunit